MLKEEAEYSEPRKRFVVSYSQIVDEVEEIDEELFNSSNPVKVPFPAIGEKPFTGWRDADTRYALEKARLQMTGLS